MKKTLFAIMASVILTITLIFGIGIPFPVKTYAAEVSIYPSSDTVHVGDSITVTVTFYGNGVYFGTGYLGCDGIFSGGTGQIIAEGDGGNSVSYSQTFYAVGEGSGSIYISGCEMSEDDPNDPYKAIIEYPADAACYINVIGYDNGGGGTGGNAGGGWEDPGQINGYEVGEGSDNTNLASLEVQGYALTDEGHDIYSVSVGNSVKTINIIAVPEDANAVVVGVGEQTLADGENIFEIYVYAENGYVRGYVVKVNRRGDKVSLSDLLAELKDTTENAVTVTLKDGDKLTKEMIDAIVKWGKELHLNRYDADGKFVYGWTLNGKDMAEMKDFKSFDPTVSFQSNAEDAINDLSNFASGRHLNFAAEGELPNGTVFTFAAGNDFKKDDTARLYYYDSNENTLTQVGEEFKVEGDEIAIPLSHCSEYFVTRALITPKVTEEKTGLSKKDLILYIALGVLLAAVIVLVILLILKQRKSKTSQTEKDLSPVDNNNEEPMDDFFDSFDEDDFLELK